MHELVHQHPIIGCRSQERQKLGWAYRYCTVISGGDLHVRCADCTTINLETDKQCLSSLKISFSLSTPDMSSPDCLQGSGNVHLVFGHTARQYLHVIQLYNWINLVQAQNAMYGMHECRQHISQTKPNHHPLIDAIESDKCCLVPGISVYAQLVVTTG